MRLTPPPATTELEQDADPCPVCGDCQCPECGPCQTDHDEPEDLDR